MSFHDLVTINRSRLIFFGSIAGLGTGLPAISEDYGAGSKSTGTVTHQALPGFSQPFCGRASFRGYSPSYPTQQATPGSGLGLWSPRRGIMARLRTTPWPPNTPPLRGGNPLTLRRHPRSISSQPLLVLARVSIYIYIFISTVLIHFFSIFFRVHLPLRLRLCFYFYFFASSLFPSFLPSFLPFFLFIIYFVAHL